MTKKNIYDYSIKELGGFLELKGHKAFRSKQIFSWLYGHRGEKVDREFKGFKNLPRDLVDILENEFTLSAVTALEVQKSKKDGTAKMLSRLADDNYVESVFMKYSYGNSLCISTQVGCRMGCKFCASTRAGLVRNLTAGEMMGQVLEAEKKPR